jgi:fatty acid desaturase
MQRHEQELPIKDITTIIADLQQPSLSIFYFDLACCVTLAALGLYLSRPLDGSLACVFGIAIASLAVYRASYFPHEISHHRKYLSRFEIVWNLTVGFSTLSPSFMHYNHFGHHASCSSGTDEDVEYIARYLLGARGAAVLLTGCLLLPFVHCARFLVLQPVAWLSPSVRAWTDKNLSSYGNFGFAKSTGPAPAEWRSWRLQEIGCFVFVAFAAAAIIFGLWPAAGVLRLYIILVLVLVLHSIRVIITNRYESGGLAQDRLEQFFDAYNVTCNRPLSYLAASLLAPIGLGLHALHHLAPQVPYHNLAEAHSRIDAAVPKNSIYHSVESPGFVRVIMDFVRRKPQRISV